MTSQAKLSAGRAENCKNNALAEAAGVHFIRSGISQPCTLLITYSKYLVYKAFVHQQADITSYLAQIRGTNLLLQSNSS